MVYRILTVIVLLFGVLGQTDAQGLSTDSLTNELQRAKDDTTKVHLYRMLVSTSLSDNKPYDAIQYAKAGVYLGKQVDFDKGVAGCYLNLALVYNTISKFDSFFYYTDSAIYWSKKVDDPNRLALVYLNRADAHMQQRNFKQSLLDCDTALGYAQQANSKDRRARINQTIGSIYFFQEKYEESKAYYELASILYQDLGNKKMYAIILNNLGNAYKRLNQYDSSIRYYSKAIQLAQETGDETNMSMFYSNISSLYSFIKQYSKAEANAKLALQYALEQGDEVDQANAYMNFAESYLPQKRIDEAIAAGLKAYAINDRYALIEEQVDAVKMLAEAYSENGNYKEANFYFRKSRDLNDSLTKKKFDEQIARMQTAFKMEEKNNEITLLTKDRQMQEQNLSRQRLLITGSLLLSILAIVAIFLLINRQRLKQRMKELQLRNEIASDLHDDVGSSLSSIHMLSEMASSDKIWVPQQKDILKKVSAYSKETMEKMSDIVWMIKQSGLEDKSLEERMKHFFYDICKSKNIQPFFQVDKTVLHKLDPPRRKMLYLVFKEAVNNAVKYSGASEIKVSITQNDKKLQMEVTDNGIGFDTTTAPKGNGLKNMQNRAAAFKGSTIIRSNVNEGTTVLTGIYL